MKGMNLSGKARHGAADADAADVGAAAHAAHPAALAHVALHHGAPAPQLHDALPGAVCVGELALLVVAAAIAALVDGSLEQPAWAATTSSSGIMGARPTAMCSRYSRVSVMLSGWTGQPGTHTMGMPGTRPPIPPEVVGQPHAAGGISLPWRGFRRRRRRFRPRRTAQARGASRSIQSQVGDRLARGDRFQTTPSSPRPCWFRREWSLRPRE